MTHMPAGPLWYALNVHHEERALSSLLRAHVEAWLPLRQKKRYTRQGKPVAGAAPLFPGYLFARFNAAGEKWRWIGDVDGVVRVLCSPPALGEKDKPVPILTRWIEGLREKITADGGVLKVEEEAAKSFYKKGQKLRIVTGAFQGLDATFDGEDEAGNIRAWLMLFGRGSLATLPLEIVEAATA